MEFICVGETLKPHGIKGEVKVLAITDDVTRFRKLKLVYIGNKGYAIERCRIDGDIVYIKFADVNDRNTAQTLVGKQLMIDRVNAVALDDMSYFIVDMIGAQVVLDDGTIVGNVTDVLSYGSADVFCVSGDKQVMFPFLKRIISSVDTESKCIMLKSKEFHEVAVFED